VEIFEWAFCLGKALGQKKYFYTMDILERTSNDRMQKKFFVLL